LTVPGVVAAAGIREQSPVVKKLSANEIQRARTSVPTWAKRGQVIRHTYEFADFLRAMKFVNAVARAAERAQHHPDIDIRWNRVTLALTTHDAGGLTEKDFALAVKADALSAKLGSGSKHP
jgi:4a-hydroxytetrahydrobiopterin dehydratase